MFLSDDDGPTDGLDISDTIHSSAAVGALDHDGYVRYDQTTSSSSAWMVVGARCTVHKCGSGTVRWMGVMNEVDSVGVELDRPKGLNDGSTPDGQALFSCKPNHGVFVKASAVEQEVITHKPASSPTTVFRVPSGKSSKSKKTSTTRDTDVVVMDQDIVAPADTQYGTVISAFVATKSHSPVASPEADDEVFEGFDI
jgi:hypothetical protein